VSNAPRSALEQTARLGFTALLHVRCRTAQPFSVRAKFHLALLSQTNSRRYLNSADAQQCAPSRKKYSYTK
jgi:hypothetical protein